MEDVIERHGAAGGAGGLGFAVQWREFAGGGVSLHLEVPAVIGPGAELRGELSPLLKPKFADGRFDFLNGAHIGNGPGNGNIGNHDFAAENPYGRADGKVAQLISLPEKRVDMSSVHEGNEGENFILRLANT